MKASAGRKFPSVDHRIRKPSVRDLIDARAITVSRSQSTHVGYYAVFLIRRGGDRIRISRDLPFAMAEAERERVLQRQHFLRVERI